ncbi:MAG: 3-oxoacyl-ACP reductase FabG [Planctomycetota bacterium]|nr:MAG: 3-oxoacyl-ACP reductase FabG [Planctomycetota bacterium]
MSLKRVLVTGSSKGIGRAIAVELANDGFHVVVHYLKDEKGAQETAEQIGIENGSSSIVQFDVSDRSSAKKTIESDMDTNGVYYGVVCNAGICRDGSFPALTGEDWDDVIHTNLDSFFNVIQPIVMPMVRSKQKGRIVTLSSVSGIAGNRGQTNYAAAKAGIIGATKSLAIELAKRGITVNCVAPGLIETDMINDVPLDEVKKIIPLRRLGQPKEVAGLVSYLFSDKAAYITRQVISINGGMI